MLPYPAPDLLDLRLTEGVILRRAMALLVDMFCIGVLFWGAVLFIALFGFLTLGFGWLAYHLLPALPFAYYILLIGGGGATPGQRLLGLTLRQDADLARPSFAQALAWTLLLYVSFSLGGLPFLTALLSPRKRAAHDFLSGLVMVRAVPQISY